MRNAGAIDPVDVDGVDCHEDNANERGEEDIDKSANKSFDIGADFLKAAKRFAATLIFEQGVRQRERPFDASRIEFGAGLLGDDVDVIILEILGNSRDEGYEHREGQQRRHTLNEIANRILMKLGGVIINNVAENGWVEQRECLVDRRQNESEDDQTAVGLQIRQ